MIFALAFDIRGLRVRQVLRAEKDDFVNNQPPDFLLCIQNIMFTLHNIENDIRVCAIRLFIIASTLPFFVGHAVNFIF